MSLFAVSDLHIEGPDDPLYRDLLSLLNERTASGDTVVLAGDLFDLYVGNKEVFTSRYIEFFYALQSFAQRGVTCHYIEGNHDFLLKKVFKSFSSVYLHPHDVSVMIQGKRFYFAHGDTVVRSDYGYRFLRAFFRSPIMKFLVFLVPGSWLAKFGEWSSAMSRKRNSRQAPKHSLQKREFLRTAYRSHAAEILARGYDFVVMGHCHDLDEMVFKIGTRQGQYVNIGYPRIHGSFLSWSPGDQRIQREKLSN